MSRFTVLGATGFVGSGLVRFLRDRQEEVSAPARGEELSGQDLGHVIYCIGMTGDYLKDPVATARAHVCVLADVLHGTLFESLTYLSSTRLYDSGAGDAGEGNDLILNPATPRHLFDLTKCAGEALCVAHGGGQARVARLSSVYSDDLGSDNYLHEIIRRALATPELTLNSGAGLERDYIHLDDVCRAIHAIATAGRRPIYNVASGVNVSNRDLFAWIERETGHTIRATGPSRRVPSPRIDVSALKGDFGIVPVQLSERLPAIMRANAAVAAS